jgi:hypothetical protein
MAYLTIIWDEDDNPDGNVEHIARHGLTTNEVEHVIENAEAESVSQSSGLPCVFGFTPSGDYIIVVFDQVDEDTIYPVTAYEVPEEGMP